MKKNILLSLLLIALLFVLAIALVPKTYTLQAFQTRADTQYWELSTGSRIGYSHIPSKGIRKVTPIIFLQGGPGAPIFDSNIDVLSKLTDEGYDVYLYDLLGCGRSNRLDNIEEYTVDRHTKDLAEIINIIGAEKVILIAQSWGAMLATNYIADHPSKIEKVIFTSPGPILPIHKKVEEINTPDSLNLKMPLVTNAQGKEKVYTIRAKVVEFMAKHFDCKLASDSEMDDFASCLSYEMNKSTVVDTSRIKLKPGYGYYVNIKTAQSFDKVTDKRTILAECKFPVLLLRGQYDWIKWGYTEEYLSLFKNHQLVIIPDAGHSIATEQAERYINAILEFCL